MVAGASVCVAISAVSFGILRLSALGVLIDAWLWRESTSHAAGLALRLAGLARSNLGDNGIWAVLELGFGRTIESLSKKGRRALCESRPAYRGVAVRPEDA